jgi:hypothetical protein
LQQLWSFWLKKRSGLHKQPIINRWRRVVWDTAVSVTTFLEQKKNNVASQFGVRLSNWHNCVMLLSNGKRLPYTRLTNWLHGFEPFLRSRQLCSYSRTSQHFTEPEGSLPCSQKPSTDPYPETGQSSPYYSILSEIHFNILHPPTCKFLYKNRFKGMSYRTVAFGVQTKLETRRLRLENNTDSI